MGLIECGELNKDSAGYIAGYSVKKMTAQDDMRLRGRYPEFPFRSNRPGIGHDAMWDVASKLLQQSLDEGTDVPSVLRSYGKLNPIGRYLRMKLRRMIGHDEKAPPEAVARIVEEMRPLREASFEASKSFRQAIIDEGSARVQQIEARNAIFRKRKII